MYVEPYVWKLVRGAGKQGGHTKGFHTWREKTGFAWVFQLSKETR